MVEPRDHIFTIEKGQKILVQVDVQTGHFSARGVVMSLSQHSFRLRCTPPLPVEQMTSGQDTKISLAEMNNLVPVTTRFIRAAEDDPRVVVLQIPSASWRRNRRSFFRGNVSIPVEILKSNGKRLGGETVNVSGGGLLMVAKQILKVHEEFQIILYFDEMESIGSKARVVWADYDADGGGRYGIKFAGINRRDQNKICRLVQVKEFEDRRAELKELTGRT